MATFLSSETENRPTNSDRKLKYLKEFISLSPPTYAGNSGPFEAENWLRGVTKCLDIIDVPGDLRVTLAAFMLTGEADRWWEFIQKGREVGSINWEEFERRFLRMYFPGPLRMDKTTELYELSQGKLTVGQYQAKFINLTRYAPSIWGPEIFKDRFIGRLKPSLAATMEGKVYRTYEEAEDEAFKAEIREELERRKEYSGKEVSSRSGGRRTTKRSQSHGNRWCPYDCLRCGKPGHFQSYCPRDRSLSSNSRSLSSSSNSSSYSRGRY